MLRWETGQPMGTRGTHTVPDAGATVLREAIARSGLTTAQIIAKVGCTRKSLSNWRGGQRPSDFYIGKLSEVLGADLWRVYVAERPTHAPTWSRAQGAGAEANRLSVGALTVDWMVIAL